MDTQEVKTKIKDLLGDKYNSFIALFKSENFAEVAAKDGSMLFYEGDLAEGVALFLVTAEGNKPVEDGTIELADGTMLECMGGVVTKITATAAATEDKVEEEKPEAMALTPEVEAAIAAVKEELQGQIDELKSMMGDYAKTPDINEKVDSAIAELNDLLAKKTDKDDAEAKFSQIIDIVKQIADLPVAPAKEEKFEQKSKRVAAIERLSASMEKLEKQKITNK